MDPTQATISSTLPTSSSKITPCEDLEAPGKFCDAVNMSRWLLFMSTPPRPLPDPIEELPQGISVVSSTTTSATTVLPLSTMP